MSTEIPSWLPSVLMSEEFHDKWILLDLPHGADFGKFVPDGYDSGAFYDATGTVLKEWPRWAPLPEGAVPDPHLFATPPTPRDAPLTVTILKPVSDVEELSNLLMFALAKMDGVTLRSPAQPEWDLYSRRASTALELLRSVDQLRSAFPTPVTA